MRRNLERIKEAAYPYRTTEVAMLLGQRFGGPKWTIHRVATVAAFLGVTRSENEYHARFTLGRNVIRLYSESFLELINRRLSQDPDLLKKAEDARRKSK